MRGYRSGYLCRGARSRRKATRWYVLHAGDGRCSGFVGSEQSKKPSAVHRGDGLRKSGGGSSRGLDPTRASGQRQGVSELTSCAEHAGIWRRVSCARHEPGTRVQGGRTPRPRRYLDCHDERRDSKRGESPSDIDLATFHTDDRGDRDRGPLAVRSPQAREPASAKRVGVRKAADNAVASYRRPFEHGTSATAIGDDADRRDASAGSLRLADGHLYRRREFGHAPTVPRVAARDAEKDG